MHVARLIVSLAFLAVAGWIVWTFVQAYRKETGSTFDRLLMAARESATILWAKFCMIVAAVVSQLDNLADFIGQPEWKDAINTYLGDPKIIAGVMLAISVITISARKRTL